MDQCTVARLQKNVLSALNLVLVLGVASASSPAMADSTQQRLRSLPPLEDFIPKEVRDRIDQRKNSPEVENDALPSVPARTDLRYRDTAVKKQFGGTCSAFGLVAAMENVLGGHVDLSARDAWSKYHQYSARTAEATLEKTGIVENQWWPQNDIWPTPDYKHEPQYKIAHARYLEDNVSNAVQALADGSALYFGVATPADMVSCQAKIRPTSKITKGGHAFAVVGYELDSSEPAGGYFLVKNSWGPKCGEKGYQWFPFSLCKRSGMYCVMWAIDKTVANVPQ